MKYFIIFFCIFILLISIYFSIRVNHKNINEPMQTVEGLTGVKCPDGWGETIGDINDKKFICKVPEVNINAINPNSMGGCCLWLDANDSKTIILSNNNTVSKWKDKSPNNYVFTQTESNSQPNYTQTPTGKNIVNFNSSLKQALTVVKTDKFNVNQSFSMFAVFRFNDSSPTGTVFSKCKYNDVCPGGVYMGKINNKFNTSLYNVQAHGNIVDNQYDNKWVLVEMIYNKNGNTTLYINGYKTNEFPTIQNEYLENPYSAVIGGSTDKTGFITKDIYVNEPYLEDYDETIQTEVEQESIENGIITIETNGTQIDMGDSIIVSFSNDGFIRLNCKDTKTLRFPALVVGGGGAGGGASGAWEGSGGGGAGEVLVIEDLSLKTGDTLNITVGKGGNGSRINGTSSKIINNNNNTFYEAFGGGGGGIGAGGMTSTGIGIKETPNIGSGGGGQGWGQAHAGGQSVQRYSRLSNPGATGFWQSGGGGGGGALSPGLSNPQGNYNGGNGGQGYIWPYDKQLYATGGGGGQGRDTNNTTYGQPNGGTKNNDGKPATTRGGGGGGGGAFSSKGGAGGDGIVNFRILKSDLKYQYITIKKVTVTKVIHKQRWVDHYVMHTVPADLQPDAFLNGDIAEIIAFSRETDINEDFRKTIETYLTIKWNLDNLKDFISNDVITHLKENLNIGTKNDGFIGYDPNQMCFTNIDGTCNPPAWSFDLSNAFTINFSSPTWQANDTLKNACIWSRRNKINWQNVNEPQLFDSNCNRL